MTTIDKPFQVRTTEGNLHSEHTTQKQAEAAAAIANNQASALDIRTRYETTVA